jgi:hypothetical protein
MIPVFVAYRACSDKQPFEGGQKPAHELLRDPGMDISVSRLAYSQTSGNGFYGRNRYVPVMKNVDQRMS